MQLAISRNPDYPELDWFIPFIYLDVDAPRLAGREIYGYPKQFGEVSITRYAKGDAAQDLRLESTVIRRGSTEASREIVISVTGPQAPPRVVQRYTSSQEMFWDLWEQSYQPKGDYQRQRVFPIDGVSQIEEGMPHSHTLALAEGSPGPGAEVINAVLMNNIGNVFLKQFRASENPEQVCYQAVCKTDTVPAIFRGGEQLDPSEYAIQVQALESEGLVEYLDESCGIDPIQPVFAYWLDMDFELTAGRVIANPLRRPLRAGPVTHR
jgi:hypothetical protein